MKDHLMRRSPCQAVAVCCRAVLWVLLALFAGTSHFAGAQQPGVTPPRIQSPEGVWYETGGEKSTLWILVEITATKREGVFQVDGVFADIKTRRSLANISRGVYRQAENKLDARFNRLATLTDFLVTPDTPITGSIFVRDGTPRLLLDLSPAGGRYELVRDPDFASQRQSAAPSPATETHRELEIASLTAEPAEVESGGTVTIKYDFMARDIPETGLKVADAVTVSGPMPAPAKAEAKRSLTHFQHRSEGAGRMDGGGSGSYRITPTDSGRYACKIELKAPGYSGSVSKEVNFTVKSKPKPVTTGAVIPPGTPIWVLKKIDIDPQKIAENDAKAPERERAHWQVSPNSASATYQAPIGNSNDGPKMQVSIQFGGAVPSVLRPGDKFDVTMSLKAGPEKNISGYMGISGRVGAGGLKVTRTPADVIEGAGCVSSSGPFVASRQITYHCEVPKDADPRFQKEITVARIVSGRGSLAVCHYVADVASATTPPAGDTETATEESGKPPTIANVAGADTARAALGVRMQSPTMVLVPGEPSWPNNVGVTGWQPNGNRVEVEIPVQDNWGSLQVSRNLVVAPGPTSKATSSMTGPEDWFQEMWSARIGARAGVYEVPVIVRQAGTGEAMTTLSIYVAPKGISGLGQPGIASGATVAQRIFASESVFLARFGGYRDAGANSTNEEDHLRYAQRQSSERLVRDLVEKFQIQFELQAARGHEAACQFYAKASARLARYDVNLGDAGSNQKDPEPHLNWARRQTDVKLREAIAEKIRALMAGVK